jgi:hypothetical protein
VGGKIAKVSGYGSIPRRSDPLWPPDLASFGYRFQSADNTDLVYLCWHSFTPGMMNIANGTPSVAISRKRHLRTTRSRRLQDLRSMSYNPAIRMVPDPL